MEYKIIDNFLEKEEFLKIKNIMMSNDFPWFYNSAVADYNLKDSFYFTHCFFNDCHVRSDKYNLLYPIFNKLNLKSIIRAKGNFYSKTEKIEEHGTHSDYEFTHKGFILYINTNNGFTRLKNGEKINSIENRGLFFNPGLEHNSSSCTDQHGRININFNYF
jgi:hypothetical protein